MQFRKFISFSNLASTAVANRFEASFLESIRLISEICGSRIEAMTWTARTASLAKPFPQYLRARAHLISGSGQSLGYHKPMMPRTPLDAFSSTGLILCSFEQPFSFHIARTFPLH
jgi:hypothetical protein